MKFQFLLKSINEGRTFDLDVQMPKTSVKGLIVFCHGFKGFKDWGYFNLMSDYFSDLGYAFAKFNFSFNGTTPDCPLEFVDLEAFGQNNFTKELNDLKTVTDFLFESKELNFKIDIPLIVMGHSKGGATALIGFLDDLRYKKAAVLAPVIEIKKRYAENELEEWKKKGVQFIHNSRTKQDMPLYYQLAQDVLENQVQFDLQKRLITVDRPVMCVHGTKDPTVSHQESLSVSNLKNVIVSLIEGADHVFGGSQPYLENSLPIDAKSAFDKVIDFLEN